MDGMIALELMSYMYAAAAMLGVPDEVQTYHIWTYHASGARFRYENGHPEDGSTAHSERRMTSGGQSRGRRHTRSAVRRARRGGDSGLCGYAPGRSTKQQGSSRQECTGDGALSVPDDVPVPSYAVPLVSRLHCACVDVVRVPIDHLPGARGTQCVMEYASRVGLSSFTVSAPASSLLVPYLLCARADALVG